MYESRPLLLIGEINTEEMNMWDSDAGEAWLGWIMPAFEPSSSVMVISGGFFLLCLRLGSSLIAE